MHLTDHARRKWAVPSEEEDRHVKGAIIYYIIVILGMLKEYTYTVLRVYIYISNYSGMGLGIKDKNTPSTFKQ